MASAVSAIGAAMHAVASSGIGAVIPPCIRTVAASRIRAITAAAVGPVAVAVTVGPVIGRWHDRDRRHVAITVDWRRIGIDRPRRRHHVAGLHQRFFVVLLILL